MSEFIINDTTAFDLQNAYSLARAANLAYKDEEKIEKTVKEWGLQAVSFFDESGTQAFVMSNDKIIVVAFRGTEEFEDWVADARAISVDGPLQGQVHKGFYVALKNVWGEIKKSVEEWRTNNQQKSLWFTGHSLGAALAILAVAKLYDEKLCDEKYSVKGLYTFGQPNIGDEKFAENFASKFKHAFRFVNNNDSVTRLPLLKKPVGTRKYFLENGELVDYISSEDEEADRINGRTEDIGELGLDRIKDHYMDEYERLVKKALQR